MKAKFLVTTTLVLMLLLGFASQVFAAGTSSGALLRATRTRTSTKVPTVTLTRTPTPGASVTGSVLIHGGGCCMGGPVGTTISIDTAFSAASTAGAVTQMRIGHQSCTTTLDLSAVAWEPFAASKNFPYTITIQNWVGYYVDVQYRDAAGNVSPIYCDDISIEGMPPIGQTGTPGTKTATPSPTKTRTPTPTPSKTLVITGT